MRRDLCEAVGRWGTGYFHPGGRPSAGSDTDGAWEPKASRELPVKFDSPAIQGAEERSGESQVWVPGWATAWALIHKKINSWPKFIQKELREKEGSGGPDGFSAGLGVALGLRLSEPLRMASARVSASACTWECERVCVGALGGGERTCVPRGTIITSIYEALLFHVFISFP